MRGYGVPRRGAAWPALLLLCLGLAACAADRSALRPQAPSGPAEIEYYDSGNFDRNFSALLRGRPPQATVLFPAAFTINSIPERFEKWLSMVEKTGGRVELRAEPEEEADKSILTEALSFFIRVFEYLKEKAVYDPVRNYDAAIWYKRKLGLVTRVVFSLRP